MRRLSCRVRFGSPPTKPSVGSAGVVVVFRLVFCRRAFHRRSTLVHVTVEWSPRCYLSSWSSVSNKEQGPMNQKEWRSGSIYFWGWVREMESNGGSKWFRTMIAEERDPVDPTFSYDFMLEAFVRFYRKKSEKKFIHKSFCFLEDVAHTISRKSKRSIILLPIGGNVCW